MFNKSEIFSGMGVLKDANAKYETTIISEKEEIDIFVVLSCD